jgi:hypothetical protein
MAEITGDKKFIFDPLNLLLSPSFSKISTRGAPHPRAKIRGISYNSKKNFFKIARIYDFFFFGVTPS